MVALTNDFSFVQTHRGVGRRGEAIRQPPPAASGVVVESRPGFTVRRVHEAVADQDVPFAQRGDGVRIEVPAFETISLLVLS